MSKMKKKNQKKNQIILEFPSEEYVDAFAAWWSDGGGEWGYFECAEDIMEDDELLPVIRCDYSKCFPAWGYNPKKDGIKKIIFMTKEMIEKEQKRIKRII